ncbi:trimeric LpxA-like protein [Dacryopinax primogenitus]|uniref:Trimeric LpxA-like protein n=1 Tax=Dacryopinax primogenitus (strain DJM 731) TaxID=1858805 RepID=M5FVT1_DACPD|nr:trimeric LpxA-like protein [Dacryopinax primogenitus]EJU00464.1 trimeric LpxA-like protein [Dacryopinax primogenitus]
MPAASQKDLFQIEQAKGLRNVPWCDQYERMISGMLYDAMDATLASARFRARKLMNKYNSHFPDDATAASLTADRTAILNELLGRAGDGIYIEPPFSVDYGSNISFGDRFYANFYLTILDCGLVTIGDRVMFGPHVSIFAATHEVEVQSRRENIEYAGSVLIGDDCWIGGHVTILPGVTIGQGCTIGAGSVVTKSIPEWSVAILTSFRSVPRPAHDCFGLSSIGTPFGDKASVIPSLTSHEFRHLQVYDVKTILSVCLALPAILAVQPNTLVRCDFTAALAVMPERLLQALEQINTEPFSSEAGRIKWLV